MILKLNVPVIDGLTEVSVGDRVEISGIIHTARDAVMTKLVRIIESDSLGSFPVNLAGSAIMHTAYGPSGFGPTSSNKEEIENALSLLSQVGVKIHIGKGALKQNTISEISKFGAIFVVVPPVSALFQSKLTSKRMIAFEEEGIEAMHELNVLSMPGIVAAAKGFSMFERC